MPLPLSFKQYFWDVKFKSLDVKKNQRFILERLLEYGNLSAYKWLKKNFSPLAVKKTVKTSRALSKKSANFYALIFNIPKSQILCLNKSWRKKQGILWPY